MTGINIAAVTITHTILMVTLLKITSPFLNLYNIDLQYTSIIYSM